MKEAIRLPSGWAEVPLDLVGKWCGGGTPSKANPAYWTKGTIPWLSPKDMKSFRITDAEDKISSVATSETNVKPFPPGTVLIVVRSGILSRTLPVGVCEVRATMNQDLKGITPFPGIDPYFVAYSLTGRERSILNDCCKDGTTVASIEVPRFKSLPFRLPPAKEQRRIVAKIEELFSDLDAGVAALQRIRAKLKRYRASVLKAAVEGKLTVEWRAKHPNVESASELLKRILTERRRKWEADQLARFAKAGRQPPKGWKEKYEAPNGPNAAVAPTIPDSWEIASIDQLTTTITSGSRDWSQYYGQGTGTFIMAQNVRPGRLDLSSRQQVGPPQNDRDRVRSQVMVGDLLVTIVGANTGDVCLVSSLLPEHYVCQSVALMRPVDNSISKFLEHYLVSPENGQRHFEKIIYGQGRPHLGFDELGTTPILIPPAAEQSEIVAQVEQRVSMLDQMNEMIGYGLRRAARLRQSILKRAFEGKLLPQDPNDEPASVLLERIKESCNDEQITHQRRVVAACKKRRRISDSEENESLRFEAAIEPGTIPTGEPATVKLRLRSRMVDGLRNLWLATDPNVGSAEWDTIPQHGEVQTDLHIPEQPLPGVVAIAAHWRFENVRDVVEQGTIQVEIKVKKANKKRKTSGRQQGARKRTTRRRA